MKSLFQNFLYVLNHFKSSSVINILGLSVALMVFFIVLMQVYYDFTFDRGYTHAKRIFQLNNYDANEGSASTHFNVQRPARIKDQIPETEAYCMVANWGLFPFDLIKGDGTPETHTIPYLRSTRDFWKIFTPEILSGDTAGIFSSPGKAMISEKTAIRMFGDKDPIGQAIKFHFGDQQMTISAVYRDFPDNSSLGNGLYTYLPPQEESEWSFWAYFLVNPENIKAVNDKINTAEVLGEGHIKFLEEHPEVSIRYQLTSLNELYLTNAGKGGSKRINTTIALLAIGVMTLFIAFVNFVNLSLAMAPSRVRGITIRKVLGINKTTLKFTIAMESVLFTLAALIIAFAGIYWIKGTTLADKMFASDLSLWAHAPLLTVASVLILLIAFLVGLYAMRYTTSFEETEVLKGSFALGTQGVKLRNILIVVQFTTAIILICIATFIKRQNDFMMSYDWGMPKENIVYLSLSGLDQSSEAFGQELLRDPRIIDYSISRALPGRVYMTWGREFEGKQISLHVWSVDDRFFDFFDVDIVAGRKPEHMDSVVSQIVVNEAFLQKYEFDESIVGKDFSAFGPGRIQAIAKDVNFQSLHEPITPMAFGVLSRWQNFQYFLIKLSGSDMRGAIDYMEQTWKKFSNEDFDMHFLDEEMDKLYEKETNMARLIALFGFIIVLIAVMGVYGLILFNTRYKTKEIAIRKVNGSEISEIMLMLNRTVLIQLSIAFVIAVPIAWFAVSKWLDGFAYKTEIKWWIFLLSGLLVFLITVITVSWQSYKAASANPVEAIKSE